MTESTINWRKARRSWEYESDCVEVAAIGGQRAVRDSKDPNGPRLNLSPAELRDLLDQAKHA